MSLTRAEAEADLAAAVQLLHALLDQAASELRDTVTFPAWMTTHAAAIGETPLSQLSGRITDAEVRLSSTTRAQIHLALSQMYALRHARHHERNHP